MRPLKERLAACYTGAVHDVLRMMGHERVVLPPDIKPLDPSKTLAAKGVLGYVVDGGSRDTALVLEQGFPVWCSFLTPSDIVERWIPDAYGAPIDIGGVTIATGDWLLADRDGVVIVPRAIAEEAVRRTEEVMSTESDMRRALVGGMDPVDAYNKYGKF